MTKGKRNKKRRFITDIASLYYAEEQKTLHLAMKRKLKRQKAKNSVS